MLIICLLMYDRDTGLAQANSPAGASQVIEGGKLVVELIKAISSKKETDRDPGCKNTYADLCVINQSNRSLTISLLYRSTGESREMVVLPEGKECCLQAKVGVWTYDLKVPGSPLSLRKGDVLIEACNNLEMTIK